MGHVSIQKHVATEWVLLFSEAVVVSVLSDLATLAAGVVFGVHRNQRGHVPANLLRCRLLPLASLSWDCHA